MAVAWSATKLGRATTDVTIRDPVVLTATPAQGSRFIGWEGHPDCLDGALTMGADRACVARFEQTDDFDEDGDEEDDEDGDEEEEETWQVCQI